MAIFVTMPIQCLTSIRFSLNQDSESLYVDPRLAHTVSGIYEFEINQLGTEVALFNDGLPALMILPSPTLSSVCRVRNKMIALDAIWFTAGAVSQSYWLPPSFTGKEKLTIIRFFPSAWQALFGKPAVADPYVHNLADHEAELGRLFHEVYEASSVVEGAVDLLLRLFAQKAIDQTALAFDRAAISSNTDKAMLLEKDEPIALSHFHPKWVQRQFKKSIGISPYQFEQLQRFIAAYHQINEDAAPNLHGIADTCGYYDANHLIKDFNKYLGRSPRQYFKNAMICDGK